jgi:predicted transcriptional regulator
LLYIIKRNASLTQKTVALRLNEDIQKRLQLLGKVRDRSPHYLMKEAVERYLTNEEAKEEEKRILQERWETYQLSDVSYTQDQVEAQISEMIAANSKQTA